jgi:RNA polymerase sporulation-specific sigma factor
MDLSNNTELSVLINKVRVAAFADDAFSQIESLYTPMMQKKVASFFGTYDDPEAMQEARIALLSAAMTYNEDKGDGVTFGLYAGICVNNRLKSLIRKRHRDSGSVDKFAAQDDAISTANVEDAVAARDLCDRVMALARGVLSDFEYEVFRLSFEGYATRDIAQKLLRTPKSVDNAKFRISARLRGDKEILAILADI